MKKELQFAALKSILKYGRLYKRLARRKNDDKNQRRGTQMNVKGLEMLTKREQVNIKRLEKQEAQLKKAINEFRQLKSEWYSFIYEKYGIDLNEEEKE